MAEGRDILFDIDWQGTQQLREKARGDWQAFSSCRRQYPDSKGAYASVRKICEHVIQERMAKAGED